MRRYKILLFVFGHCASDKIFASHQTRDDGFKEYRHHRVVLIQSGSRMGLLITLRWSKCHQCGFYRMFYLTTTRDVPNLLLTIKTEENRHVTVDRPRGVGSLCIVSQDIILSTSSHNNSTVLGPIVSRVKI